jgi:RimJ/RimL family protein N-acetyltransferase
MLIWDCPDVINDWVSTRGGGRAYPGHCSAFGWVVDGKLVGGIVFTDFNGAQCLANIALDHHTFPRALLHAGLSYTFSQLQLRRLTFVIKEANLASQELVRRLGAVPEATLRDADIDGNLLIYALFPDDCKIWSRLKNGKKLRCSGSTGSN